MEDDIRFLTGVGSLSVTPISVPSAVLRKNGWHKYEPFSFFLETTRWAYRLLCFCRQVPIIYYMQCTGNEMFGCEALLSRNLQNREEIVTHELEKTQWVCLVKTDKGLARRKVKSHGGSDTGFALAEKARFHEKALTEQGSERFQTMAPQDVALYFSRPPSRPPQTHIPAFSGTEFLPFVKLCVLWPR